MQSAIISRQPNQLFAPKARNEVCAVVEITGRMVDYFNNDLFMATT
jgi:hypothetical protein